MYNNDDDEDKLKCDDCKGEKELEKAFMLAVINRKPGATSFMRTFCVDHWSKHLIDYVTRAITDYPLLKIYFDEKLKFMQECKKAGKI